MQKLLDYYYYHNSMVLIILTLDLQLFFLVMVQVMTWLSEWPSRAQAVAISCSSAGDVLMLLPPTFDRSAQESAVHSGRENRRLSHRQQPMVIDPMNIYYAVIALHLSIMRPSPATCLFAFCFGNVGMGTRQARSLGVVPAKCSEWRDYGERKG